MSDRVNPAKLTKKSVILEGTSFDDEGTIKLTSQCDGVHINKRTRYNDGDIVLTLSELEGILESIKSEFNQR